MKNNSTVLLQGELNMFFHFLESHSSTSKSEPNMQNLRQRAIFGRKNSGRKVMVVQKLLPMQHMQQNSKVSRFVVVYTFRN